MVGLVGHLAVGVVTGFAVYIDWPKCYVISTERDGKVPMRKYAMWKLCRSITPPLSCGGHKWACDTRAMIVAWSGTAETGGKRSHLKGETLHTCTTLTNNYKLVVCRTTTS